jgi:hypothetical protein
MTGSVPLCNPQLQRRERGGPINKKNRRGNPRRFLFDIVLRKFLSFAGLAAAYSSKP